MALSGGQIFAIAIGVYFLSALIPSALDTFFSADTANWSAGVAALWDVLPLAIVGVLLMKYVPSTSKGGAT